MSDDIETVRATLSDDLAAWQRVAADVAEIFGSPTMLNDPEFIEYAERKFEQGETLAAALHSLDHTHPITADTFRDEFNPDLRRGTFTKSMILLKPTRHCMTTSATSVAR